MRCLSVVLALALSAVPALADGVVDGLITNVDRERLARFDETRTAALAEARAAGTPEDLRVLEAALAGTPRPLAEDFDATGSWRCRTIKLGGLLPLVVYPQFKCRISDDGSGWVLQKLSGSQRTRGRFYVESDTRLIYLGAGSVNDDPPRAYGDEAKENQVAYAERLGKNRLVLQFPQPVYESHFDLLVLER
jgi:hypothetical protein